MSLIIAYVGKKGCVMASDKRKIGYFGDKQNLKELESDLYSGKIDNDEDFLKRADELGISIKITDDANKLKIIGNSIRGEVSTKGTWVVMTLDPDFHFGSYFMPATERFLDGFFPWLAEGKMG